MNNAKKSLILSYKNLVIGSNLEAFLFAFYNKLPVIYTRNLAPYYFEELENLDLGKNKLDVWNKLAFQLSIGGYNPFENKVKHIRYVDKNLIKIITVDDGVYKVKFENLWIFDDHDIQDMPPHSGKTSTDNMVIDIFNVKSGYTHDYEFIDRKNRLINKIYFPPKKNGSRKDLMIVQSFMSDKELQNSYPPYFIKIKTENLMRELKFIQNQHHPIAIEHLSRRTTQLGNNIYEDFDNVKFAYTDVYTIDLFAKKWAKIDYMKYFRLKLKI